MIKLFSGKSKYLLYLNFQRHNTSRNIQNRLRLSLDPSAVIFSLSPSYLPFVLCLDFLTKVFLLFHKV